MPLFPAPFDGIDNPLEARIPADVFKRWILAKPLVAIGVRQRSEPEFENVVGEGRHRLC